MTVEEHSVQAGFVVVQAAAGGEQGGGVQGGPEEGHCLTLLLLGLAVGRQGPQDPPAQPHLQHPSVGSGHTHLAAAFATWQAFWRNTVCTSRSYGCM